MNEITEIFKHCSQVAVFDDGRIVPSRFTNERLGFYAMQPRTPYSLCPAGVTMEFYTESREISFDCKLTLPQNEYIAANVIDVYENDEFVKSIHPAKYDCRIQYRLQNEGKVKVCLYLPVCSDIEFKNIELGKYTSVSMPEKKMLVIGDSIFQGLFGENPSLAIVPRIARHYNVDYLNASVGGEIYRGDSLDKLSFTPDIILVELGTNDIGFIKDYDTICRNIEAFYSNVAAEYPKAKIISVTPFHMTNYGDGTEETAKVEEMSLKITDKVFEVCEKYNIPVFKGRELLDKNADLYADYCHPNNSGFGLIADRLFEKLKDTNIF